VRYLEENGLLGKSKLIMELRKNIINYAKADLNILITGEIGTGKKSVASYIHKLSNRSKNNFVISLE
jgi:anaerobic nitric oxide reductase transcription regulator